MNTKNKFQQIADNLELPLIFANPSLANLNLDSLALSDFNDDGLALIVSPIYASGLPVDDYGRVKRLFEISVVSLLPLDFDDEEAQAKLHFCEQKLLQLITMMRLDATTANHFIGKFDSNLCGIFINAYWSDGGLCWYDKKIYFDQSEFKGLGLEKAPIAVRKISSDKIMVGEISLTEKLANFTVEADETVTELSENAVKSSGIWSWVTGLFVRKDDEDKGSAAVEGHEQEYDHDAFLTSVPPIPTIPSNAAQITVSDPVTPDFTPVVQSNNLQQVTNKVAGLQESRKLIYSLTTTEEITNLVILLDNEQRLMIEYSSNTGMESKTSYWAFRINDVATQNYLTSNTRTSTFLFYTGRHKFAGTMELRNIGGLIFAGCRAQQEWGADNETFTIQSRNMTGFLELPQTGINKISIFGTFNAGLTINIYRI